MKKIIKHLAFPLSIKKVPLRLKEQKKRIIKAKL